MQLRVNGSDFDCSVTRAFEPACSSFGHVDGWNAGDMSPALAEPGCIEPCLKPDQEASDFETKRSRLALVPLRPCEILRDDL